MDQYIDLVIPRGSAELVRSIQQQSRHIPVLGHSEGVCHVYVDNEADLGQALKIGIACLVFTSRLRAAIIFFAIGFLIPLDQKVICYMSF